MPPTETPPPAPHIDPEIASWPILTIIVALVALCALVWWAQSTNPDRRRRRSAGRSTADGPQPPSDDAEGPTENVEPEST